MDAKKIERLDDDAFMCYVGGLNFLGVVVNPVLKVSVIVNDRGPVVKLLETKVGSGASLAYLSPPHFACQYLVTCVMVHRRG